MSGAPCARLRRRHRTSERNNRCRVKVISKELQKRLLALEILVCFGPLLILLVIGAYAVPLQVGTLSHDANTLPFPAYVLRDIVFA